MIHVSDSCVSMPLYCGPPLGYFDFKMILMGLYIFAQNFVAYKGAAIALDRSIDNAVLIAKE